ncbi:MAG: glucose-1-phosphate cytidylyltransferase, partial [Verrucomicrobia bacterium 21-51-4]
MKVVILCGGKGTRLREETEYRPKPMVPVGGRPILWHIMRRYAHYGHKEFILCLGYKGDVIKDYFRNFRWHSEDVTLRLGDSNSVWFHHSLAEADWQVTLADTGEESMTAYRLRAIEKYLGDDEHFLFTYGDGLGDIDINASIDFHKAHKKLVTITAVHPPGRFGDLRLGDDDSILDFNEKPQAEGAFINGGYMVMDRAVFNYLPNDPTVMFEQGPVRQL